MGITEQTEKGYKVTFADATKIEVKFDQVRLGKAEKKRTVKEILTPAGYRIPESLVIQKTDTDDQKETKQRKIQAIKKQQRVEKVEDDSLKKQTSWQKFFHNKASIKSKCGFMSANRRRAFSKCLRRSRAKWVFVVVAKR